MAACGFPGNPDTYGIGIRIGYYTQAVAVWFANFFLFREAKVLRAVNKLFSLTLLIVGCLYFINARETHVIEVFLMLQVGVILGLVSNTEHSRYSSRYVKTPKERRALGMFIVMAGSLFNVCFWWWGVEVMLPTPCNQPNLTPARGLLRPKAPRHGTYIFYIFKTNIYGWAGTLMRIKSLIAAVWIVKKVLTFDVFLLMYDWRMEKTRAEFVKAVCDHQPSRGPGHAFDKKLRPSLSLEVSRDDQIYCDKKTVDLQSTTLPSETILSEATQRGEKHSKSFVILERVDASLKYFEELLSIYPENTDTLSKKKYSHSCCGLIHFNISRHDNQCTDTSTPYTHCIWHLLKTEFSNKPSRDVRWRVAIHITASGQQPVWRRPRLVHRMHRLSQASEPPDWRYIAIASDILLTQIPFVKNTKSWILMAMCQLYIVGVLVVQVETTIAFNHMEGLNSLSNLGQLIPFLLGVGGLIKVVWGKCCLLYKGVKEEPELEEESEYEKAIALYLKRREQSVGRSVARAVTV